MSINSNENERNDRKWDMSIFEDLAMPNNKAMLVGRMRTTFSLGYISTRKNTRYYKTFLEIIRSSGRTDNITVFVSEDFVTEEILAFEAGTNIKVTGTVSSFLRKEGEARKLKVYILAQKIELAKSYISQNNAIYLEGRLHKPVFRRVTTLTQKTIADLFISYITENGRREYIPCITWGENARKAIQYNLGDKIIVKGRLQSRTYLEKIDPLSGYPIMREVHEISAFEVEKIEWNEMYKKGGCRSKRQSPL